MTNKKDIQIDDLEIKINENKKPDEVILPVSKALMIKKLLGNLKENVDQLSDIFYGYIDHETETQIHIAQIADDKFASNESENGEGKVIEGVFDGENMIGPDGKKYSVPANYASKSKLVEGDIMKLTITANGTFVYKQIGPIERARIVGRLEKNSEGNYLVTAENKKWRVLTASVTFFKGGVSDEVVILVPKVGESKWAAIENIVKNT